MASIIRLQIMDGDKIKVLIIKILTTILTIKIKGSITTKIQIKDSITTKTQIKGSITIKTHIKGSITIKTQIKVGAKIKTKVGVKARTKDWITTRIKDGEKIIIKITTITTIINTTTTIIITNPAIIKDGTTDQLQAGETQTILEIHGAQRTHITGIIPLASVFHKSTLSEDVVNAMVQDLSIVKECIFHAEDVTDHTAIA